MSSHYSQPTTTTFCESLWQQKATQNLSNFSTFPANPIDKFRTHLSSGSHKWHSHLSQRVVGGGQLAFFKHSLTVCSKILVLICHQGSPSSNGSLTPFRSSQTTKWTSSFCREEKWYPLWKGLQKKEKQLFFIDNCLPLHSFCMSSLISSGCSSQRRRMLAESIEIENGEQPKNPWRSFTGPLS